MGRGGERGGARQAQQRPTQIIADRPIGHGQQHKARHGKGRAGQHDLPGPPSRQRPRQQRRGEPHHDVEHRIADKDGRDAYVERDGDIAGHDGKQAHRPPADILRDAQNQKRLDDGTRVAGVLGLAHPSFLSVANHSHLHRPDLDDNLNTSCGRTGPSACAPSSR
jgi:hypothetical protein